MLQNQTFVKIQSLFRGKTSFKTTRSPNLEAIQQFQLFWSIRFQCTQHNQLFLPQLPKRSRKFQSEALSQEIKRVVLEQHEFEIGDESIKKFFVTFGLSRFQYTNATVSISTNFFKKYIFCKCDIGGRKRVCCFWKKNSFNIEVYHQWKRFGNL